MKHLLTYFIIVLGWVLARCPRFILRALTRLFGHLILWLKPSRRRAIESNIARVFPTRDAAWRRRLAVESSCRFVETSLLSIAVPFISETRLRGMVRLSPSAAAWLEKHHASPRPTVLGTAHLCHWELQTTIGLLAGEKCPETGVIFRPIPNEPLNAFIQRTRQRFGLKLLSKRSGFGEALAILRRRGVVGVLFDQNANKAGTLTLFFDRLCSTTELPGILAQKFKTDLLLFYPRRLGFWQVALECDPVPHDGTAAGVTLALNQRLESMIRDDEETCRSWLWMHNRWGCQKAPSQRLRLVTKRSLLPEELARRGLAALPRANRFFLRLPEAADARAALRPYLPLLRASRPDAALSLVGRAEWAADYTLGEECDAYVSVPAQGWARWQAFVALRSAHPDVFLVPLATAGTAMESWVSFAPQRLGSLAAGRRGRRWLSHVCADDPTAPVASRLAAFFAHFGLHPHGDSAPPEGEAPEDGGDNED